ncbi:MAG: hypothetical protein AAF936_08630 [Pseudomonadota bacterium]
MVKTRSEYISENTSYTKIRSELHRAYKEKDPNSNIRYENGRGISIYKAKPKWKSVFELSTTKARRLEEFKNAGEKLRIAINREYDGWDVYDDDLGISQPLGDYVFSKLDKYSKSHRLDEHELRTIDDLIAKGMVASAAGQDGKHSFRMQAATDRNAIFTELKRARDEHTAHEASKNWFQRIWSKIFGDESRLQSKVDDAVKRAHNWRAIVHGNRILCEALAKDLQSVEQTLVDAGYANEPYENARRILAGLEIIQSGFTRKNYEKLLSCLQQDNLPSANLEKIECYLDLTENAGTNIERLRHVNAELNSHLLPRRPGKLNNSILSTLRRSNDLLSEVSESLSSGQLLEPENRRNLYEKLQGQFESLNRARHALENTHSWLLAPSDPVIPLLDEHLAVTYDLAVSLMKMDGNVPLAHYQRFDQTALFAANPLARIDSRTLEARLPEAKKLFQSPKHPSDVGNELYTMYNNACGDAVRALAQYKADQSERSLMILRQAVGEASRLNDRIMIAFSRHGVLGGKASAQISDRLTRQRKTLQTLQLAAAQLHSRLASSQSPDTKSHSFTSSEDDMMSVLSKGPTSKVVKPRPGHSYRKVQAVKSRSNTARKHRSEHSRRSGVDGGNTSPTPQNSSGPYIVDYSERSLTGENISIRTVDADGRAFVKSLSVGDNTPDTNEEYSDSTLQGLPDVFGGVLKNVGGGIAEQALSLQNVRSDTSIDDDDPPRPGLFPQSSQLSFVSNPDGAEEDDSLNELKRTFGTPVVSTQNEDEENGNDGAEYNSDGVEPDVGVHKKEQHGEHIDVETGDESSDGSGSGTSGFTTPDPIETPEPDSSASNQQS